MVSRQVWLAPQGVIPKLHEQAPEPQTPNVGSQAFPHDPQLCVLVWRSTQELPHCVWPASGQAQVPD